MVVGYLLVVVVFINLKKIVTFEYIYVQYMPVRSTVLAVKVIPELEGLEFFFMVGI